MTQRTRARIAALATAVLVVLTGTAHAQAVRGTLLGSVHDGQGAAIPGATVTATETQTNISRTAVTNQSGNYVFANLKDGLYRVEAELTGFKKFSRDGVDVKVNSTVRVDVVLEVGNMEETVEVVQETPLLQTDRADTGRTIEGRQVQELPLGYGRSFQGMWATVPGTVTMTRPHSQFFNPPIPGKRIFVKAHVADKYIRREKTYLIIEATATDEDGRLIETSRLVGLARPTTRPALADVAGKWEKK